MKYLGLLSDFDGTIHKADRTVSRPVMNALQRLVRAGVKFGFSTGRQFDYIQPFASKLGDVHIVCSGACLVDSEGNLLHKISIPEATVREVVRLVTGNGGAIVVKQHDHGYANDKALEIARTQRGLNLSPLAALEDWNAASFFIGYLDDRHWPSLMERDDINVCRQPFGPTQPGYFADVSAAGITKMMGIEWWCAYHDLEPQDVIAIGDGRNDLPMFETVGLGLAMGNAVQELKSKAAAVLPDIHHDGVAWAVNHYFEV